MSTQTAFGNSFYLHRQQTAISIKCSDRDCGLVTEVEGSGAYGGVNCHMGGLTVL